MMTMNIMADGMIQIDTLGMINRKFRYMEICIASRFYFNKHQIISITGNNVNVTMPRSPVKFQNNISLLTQIGCSNLLAPFSQHNMVRHIRTHFLCFLLFAHNLINRSHVEQIVFIVWITFHRFL